ncbi:MAG: cysteine desulfurase, partial [Clostridia bacterium]|nr:cysteine desulfurase [Clostridia bacterium]
MKTEIYFDNAATTKISGEVLNSMMPVLTDNYGNSNSVHALGRRANKYVDEARDQIAKTLNVKPTEIYFTSGGTEANNWAIVGLAMANRDKGNHIITSKIEHESVLSACEYLEHNGFKVTYLNVDRHGFINFADLLDAINSETILISIMSANNELGTIQNIKAIAQTAKERDIIFHTDAVQLYGHMNIDCEDIGIDALSISAHKIHGPKG